MAMYKRLAALKTRHALISLSILLAACSGGESDDLDKFMAEAAQGMRAKIDPLPEVKPYVPIE